MPKVKPPKGQKEKPVKTPKGPTPRKSGRGKTGSWDIWK